MNVDELSKEELKESLKELRSDLDDLEDTAKNDQSEFIPLARKTWGKWKTPIVGVTAIIILTIIGFSVEIPEPLIVITIGMIVTAIVSYPLAERVADYFIQDNRMPVLAQMPLTPYTVGVYKMPRERRNEIEELEGDAMPMKTDVMGDGIQVEDFSVVDGKHGKQHLVAKGIRGGMQPNWVKTNLARWKEIREVLFPRSKKLQSYEKNMPVAFHQIENNAVNMVAREFERLAVHGEKEYRNVTDESLEVEYGEDMEESEPNYDDVVNEYLEEKEDELGAN